MVKRWRYKDPDIDYGERFIGDGVSYNAVDYKYKDSSRKGNFRQWETKNTVKFREVLRQKRLEAGVSEPEKEDKSNEDVTNKVTNSEKGQPETTENFDENTSESKMHKKKKKKKDNNKSNTKEEMSQVTNDDGDGDTGDLNEATVNEKDTNNKQSKKKKKSKRKSASCDATSVTEISLRDTLDNIVTDKKKAKQNAEFNRVVLVTDSVVAVSDDSVVKKKKKKRKKDGKDSGETDDVSGNVTVEIDSETGLNTAKVSEDADDVPVKAKKSKKKNRNKETAEATNISPKKRKHNSVDGLEDKDIMGESPKKKKKKGCREPIDNGLNEVNTEAEASNDVTHDSKKKKKKRKKDKSEEGEQSTQLSEKLQKTGKDTVTEPATKIKKKKKSKNEVDNIKAEDMSDVCVATVPSKVQKKHKKSKKDTSSKDIIEINDDNKQVPFVGQWGTAAFKSAGRQEKFLKLMGGFKGAGNNSSQVKNKRNTSLTAEGEKTLNEKLETQYNTALNIITTKGRGSGLGFEKDPAEGKKFHIDISKSKSVKFDD